MSITWMLSPPSIPLLHEGGIGIDELMPAAIVLVIGLVGLGYWFQGRRKE